MWLKPDNFQPEGNVFEYPDLFQDVADALLAQKKYHEALRFFEPLLFVREHMKLSCLNGMATCYRELNLYDEAEEYYLEISQYDGANRSALLELATMFEDAEMLDRAAPYISKVVEIDRQDTRHPDGGESAANTSIEGSSVRSPGSSAIPNMLATPVTIKYSKKSIKNVREVTRYEDLRVSFLQMQILKPQLDSGNEASKEEWMRLAKILIEDFRKRKLFFPTDKSVKFFGYSKKTKFEKTASRVTQGQERVETLARKLQRSASI